LSSWYDAIAKQCLSNFTEYQKEYEDMRLLRRRNAWKKVRALISTDTSDPLGIYRQHI
jgi:hypothetical protein